MKGTNKVADKQFEEILTRYEHLLRSDAHLALKPLEFPLPVREACAKLAEDCRQAGLMCSVDDFGFCTQISDGYTFEVHMFKDYRTLDWQLQASLNLGQRKEWAQSFNVDCNGEELYQVMKELLFASAERKFAGRMETMLRSRQKTVKMKELGKANIEALAEEVIRGREYCIEYKKILAIVYVRMNKKWMAAFHIRYNRAQKQMMALKGWIEAMDRTLEGIDTEVALSPLKKNLKWKIK